MSIDIKETVYWTESPQDGFNMANGKRVDRPSSAYVLGVRDVHNIPSKMAWDNEYPDEDYPYVVKNTLHAGVGNVPKSLDGCYIFKARTESRDRIITVAKRLTDELVPFSNADNYLREVITDDNDDDDDYDDDDDATS